MDPVDQGSPAYSPEVHLSRHEQAIQILLDNMTELTRDMRRLMHVHSTSSSGSAAAASPSSRGDLHACDPEPFDGDLDEC